jgi:hypothetical protein
LDPPRNAVEKEEPTVATMEAEKPVGPRESDGEEVPAMQYFKNIVIK